MSQEETAQRIAGAVFQAELKAARALGYPEKDACISAFNALDETYLACFAPQRQFVHNTCRNGGWW